MIQHKQKALYQTVDLAVDGRGVATLTLNRPDKHNALDHTMIAELSAAATALANDPAVRVVVLTGAGKSFCAGGDLSWFAANMTKTRAERMAQSRHLADMLHQLDTLPKPLIGRINGSAYGGGVGMIAVCDLAIASSRCRFALSEVRLGLIPANISPYVVARLGVGHARSVLLSGAPFDAARAHHMGLLSDVAEAEHLDARIAERVAEHLEAAPGAIAATKRLIAHIASHPNEDNRAHTTEKLADAWDSTEGQTGVQAFLDKRLPPWRSHNQ